MCIIKHTTIQINTVQTSYQTPNTIGRKNTYHTSEMREKIGILPHGLSFIEIFMFGDCYSTPATTNFKFRPKKLA